MNKVILCGRLTKDVELKTTQNNVSVIMNTLAVKKDFKNENNTYESDFINIIAYRNNAEFISKYFNKGDIALITGRLNTRNYDDKDGKKVYITEVVIEKVEFVGSRKQEKETTNEVQETEQSDVYAEFGEQISLDDNYLE